MPNLLQWWYDYFMTVYVYNPYQWIQQWLASNTLQSLDSTVQFVGGNCMWWLASFVKFMLAPWSYVGVVHVPIGLGDGLIYSAPKLWISRVWLSCLCHNLTKGHLRVYTLPGHQREGWVYTLLKCFHIHSYELVPSASLRLTIKVKLQRLCHSHVLLSVVHTVRRAI